MSHLKIKGYDDRPLYEMWQEGVLNDLSEHSATILTEENCDKPKVE